MWEEEFQGTALSPWHSKGKNSHRCVTHPSGQDVGSGNSGQAVTLLTEMLGLFGVVAVLGADRALALGVFRWMGDKQKWSEIFGVPLSSAQKCFLWLQQWMFD